MKPEDYASECEKLDAELAAAGFDKEWGMVLGLMLGRLASRVGFAQCDDLVSRLISLAEYGDGLYTFKMERKQ